MLTHVLVIRESVPLRFGAEWVGSSFSLEAMEVCLCTLGLEDLLPSFCIAQSGTTSTVFEVLTFQLTLAAICSPAEFLWVCGDHILHQPG